MPSITFTSDAPLSASVEIQAPIRDVQIVHLSDGMLSVELAGLTTAVEILGHRETILGLFTEACRALLGLTQ